MLQGPDNVVLARILVGFHEQFFGDQVQQRGDTKIRAGVDGPGRRGVIAVVAVSEGREAWHGDTCGCAPMTVSTDNDGSCADDCCTAERTIG